MRPKVSLGESHVMRSFIPRPDRVRLFPALRALGLATGGSLVAATIGELGRPVFVGVPFLPFFAVVALLAWRAGLATALLAVALSAAGAWFLFLPPFYSWRVTSPVIAAQIGGFVAVGSLIAGALDAQRVARAEAERAARDRDCFLAIAAHELRTPMTSLKGTAQHLLRAHARGALADERLGEGLETIDREAGRLAALCADLLDLARLRGARFPLRPETVDLVAMVQEEVMTARTRLSPLHKIEVETGDGPLVVRADPLRLAQVLGNLLDNAAKFSPAGGTIRLRMAAEGAGVAVAVRDEGIGLPPEAAQSVLAPGARGTNAEAAHLPGLGLGLAIGREIIEAHGGRIGIGSEGEGRGATATVWLPTAGPPP